MWNVGGSNKWCWMLHYESHPQSLVYWYHWYSGIQYIQRNMHTVFALLCFVVVIHWLIFPYPPGLLHWHCGNLTIAPVPAKQPWWIWLSTSNEISMNNYITTTMQSTTKPCAYFLGYTVGWKAYLTFEKLFLTGRLLQYIFCIFQLTDIQYMLITNIGTIMQQNPRFSVSHERRKALVQRQKQQC